MKKTEVVNINVADIVLTGKNPRHIAKKQLKASSLFDSIKENGVQHPIEVRAIQNGKYELLSGERRLSASRELKLKTIPAIVYDEMSDADAYKKTHFENAARQDLSPLEQVADVKNLMLVHNNDIKAVASTLGMTTSAVKLRLQLGQLSAQWMKALETPRIEDGEDRISVHDLSIAHLELIARMPDHVQDELLGTDEAPIVRLHHYGRVISVKSLKRLIAGQYTRLLAEAPWDVNDAAMLPSAGSCVQCMKRSDSEAQKELWADEEQDREGRKAKSSATCLDQACFAAKHKAYRGLLIDQARKQHEALRVISFEQVDEKLKDIVLHPSQVEPAKKTDKGAFPVMLLDDNDGKISYARLKQNQQGVSEGEQSAKPKTLAQKREQLRGLRVGIVLEELTKHLLAGAMPREERHSLELMAALVAVYGGTGPAKTTERSMDIVLSLAQGGKVSVTKDYTSTRAEADTKSILWWKLTRDMKEAVSHTNAESALARESIGKWIAELVGFDWDKAFQAASEQKKEPKSWALLNEDGTYRAEKAPASDTETKKAA